MTEELTVNEILKTLSGRLGSPCLMDDEKFRKVCKDECGEYVCLISTDVQCWKRWLMYYQGRNEADD